MKRLFDCLILILVLLFVSIFYSSYASADCPDKTYSCDKNEGKGKWRIRSKTAPNSVRRKHPNPEDGSSQFRSKAAGFCNLAE